MVNGMAPELEITRALERLSAGEQDAFDRLVPAVYDHLRRLAERELRRERTGHTLTPTALVHEAYLKLVDLDRITWQGRAHFFGACAHVMRRILISHARARKSGKRGSGAAHASLDDVVIAATERPDDLMALDEALDRLAELSPRQAKVVECRYFAGMELDEVATVVGTSPATVKRDWTAARAWLNRELTA
jgi:RNA polymerase sigma-70 factor (ECF subfamily)